MALRPRSLPTALRRGLIISSVVAGIAGVGSSAFACTIIMGQLDLNPANGVAGTTVTTSASGIKVAPATYRLLYNTAMRLAAGKDCMTSTKVLKSSVATDANGAWAGVMVKIPTTAPRGTSQVCGMESTPVKNQTGTVHATFTVT